MSRALKGSGLLYHLSSVHTRKVGGVSSILFISITSLNNFRRNSGSSRREAEARDSARDKASGNLVESFCLISNCQYNLASSEFPKTKFRYLQVILWQSLDDGVLLRPDFNLHLKKLSINMLPHSVLLSLSSSIFPPSTLYLFLNSFLIHLAIICTSKSCRSFEFSSLISFRTRPRWRMLIPAR